MSCSRLLAGISELVARVEHVWSPSQSSNAGLDSAVSPRRSCPNRLILFPHLCNYFFLYYWAVSGLRRQVVQVGSGGFESGNAPSFGSTRRLKSTPIFFGSTRVGANPSFHSSNETRNFTPNFTCITSSCGWCCATKSAIFRSTRKMFPSTHNHKPSAFVNTDLPFNALRTFE